MIRSRNEQTLKYKLVYDEIIRGLTSGKYRVGDRLPSERTLAEQLNVNIVTVRRGYRELTFAGIVEKKSVPAHICGRLWMRNRRRNRSHLS